MNEPRIFEAELEAQQLSEGTDTGLEIVRERAIGEQQQPQI